MDTRLVDGLNQLLDDMLRRLHIGIAHPEVDNIGTARPRPCFQRVDFREHIRRKALDAMKIFNHGDLVRAVAALVLLWSSWAAAGSVPCGPAGAAITPLRIVVFRRRKWLLARLCEPGEPDQFRLRNPR